jgi:aldehyde dehydrogenase (NAD+)
MLDTHLTLILFQIAPDYVLCPKHLQEPLIEAIKAALLEVYSSTNGDAASSSDYGNMINLRQWNRVMGLLKNSKGEVVIGGKGDEGTRKIDFSVVKVDGNDSLMSEEIFGPVS